MHVLTRATVICAGACLAATLAPARAELDVATLKASIEASVEADYPKWDALYKDLHAHPEVAFQEVKTAAKLAAEMRSLGFEVTEKIGKTGLVMIYKNGEGPTILVRTELDCAADGGESQSSLCEPRQDSSQEGQDLRRS